MLSESQRNTVTRLLFDRGDVDGPEEPLTVFAILDGSVVRDLTEHLDASDIDAVCLYRGELEPDIAIRAPYLVKFTNPECPFLKWILEDLWGTPWGIFVTAQQNVDIEDLRRHFRRFLKVTSPTGETWLFRYYDPRVLRLYLPTCQTEEWDYVYGPADRFLSASPDPLVIEVFVYNSDKQFDTFILNLSDGNTGGGTTALIRRDLESNPDLTGTKPPVAMPAPGRSGSIKL